MEVVYWETSTNQLAAGGKELDISSHRSFIASHLRANGATPRGGFSGASLILSQLQKTYHRAKLSK